MSSFLAVLSPWVLHRMFAGPSWGRCHRCATQVALGSCSYALCYAWEASERACFRTTAFSLSRCLPHTLRGSFSCSSAVAMLSCGSRCARLEMGLGTLELGHARGDGFGRAACMHFGGAVTSIVISPCNCLMRITSRGILFPGGQVGCLTHSSLLRTAVANMVVHGPSLRGAASAVHGIPWAGLPLHSATLLGSRLIHRAGRRTAFPILAS